MLSIKIDTPKNSLTFTKADIESASIAELADALELLHYLARDLKQEDLSWKILDISDELNERTKKANKLWILK